MKRTVLICLTMVLLVSATFCSLAANDTGRSAGADVYPPSPDWISGNPHYSTGAALADLNNDQWLDLVVADGNDMAQGRLNVYYNNHGQLPTTASWQSSDLAYNGHLDVADVNGDGWLDVAVSYLGEYSSVAPIAKLYLNSQGTLSSSPSWSANIIGNAFGCDFGDINNDGRPDLAVATGWSYSPQHHYPNYVYLNVDGTLGAAPYWTSADQNDYQGCLWVDADRDGWLDLAYIGTGVQTSIYRNLHGTLSTTVTWQTVDAGSQDGIMLAAGDVTGDGLTDLLTTDNSQLGGSGRFKQYLGLAAGWFETAASWSYLEGYCSAVALADVNDDGCLDLATGAWWDSTRLFLNTGTGLPVSPTWNSQPETVIEKIVFGDVGPTQDDERAAHDVFSGTAQRLFTLSHRQIQRIDAVTVDGVPVPCSQYTYSREDGWISVATAPTQTLAVDYTYSPSLDMAISNWDSAIGNYLYYNRLSFEPDPAVPDLECTGSLSWSSVKPGTVVEGNFTVTNVGESSSLLNWTVSSHPSWGTWTFTPQQGTALLPGMPIVVHVHVQAPDQKKAEFFGTITVVNTDDPADAETVSVYLKTPKSSALDPHGAIHALLLRLAALFQQLRSMLVS